MFRNFLVVVLLQLLLVSIAGAQETRRFKQINKAFLSPHSKIVMITSHRGTHTELPENSMVAFRKGIELGVDVIEMDVRNTKDDSLVIMHDATVNRMTNGQGAVSDLTFEEIRKLRLKFNGQLTEEKVPTLEEALNLAKGKILVDLDIKTSHIPDILKVVDRTQTAGTVIFFCNRIDRAILIRGKNPAYRTLVRTHKAADVDSVFAVTKSEAIHIDLSHNTAPVIAKIKDNGARIWINATDNGIDKKASAGDLNAYDELLKNGANIIQTNNPKLVMQYLKNKHLYY